MTESELQPGSGHDRPSDSPVERLKRRDELLQVLFWLEGEGFETEMHAAGVARFLHWPDGRIDLGLEELIQDGFAVAVGGSTAGDEASGGPVTRPVRLTEAGRREGGRRFVSEFATILSRDTHHGGECHDPECDCHELGPAACTAFPRERERTNDAG